MKALKTIALLLFANIVFAQNDYQLTINGTVHNISLDEDYSITVDGKELKLKLQRNDTLQYNDPLFSFNYPKEYSVSSLKLDEGLEQLTILTAEGSGFIVQVYSTFNPTMLQEMMVNEVTKESVSYGYEMERKDYDKTLKSGQEVNVKKAVLTYKGEEEVYEITGIGKKDSGVIIMTMITNATMSNQGTDLINLFWDSFEFKE